MPALITFLPPAASVPTHDDITADSVAKAFGVPIDYDPEVVEMLRARFAERGTEMNEARMRMARIPEGRGAGEE